MKVENKIQVFNEQALQKSEIKPFKLIKSENGKRVWTSKNGLRIEAVKIGSNEYFEVHIIKGLKLGDLNNSCHKLSAKQVQGKLSLFASQYNFQFIKRQTKLIRESEAGKQLYNDWNNLRRELIQSN